MTHSCADPQQNSPQVRRSALTSVLTSDLKAVWYADRPSLVEGEGEIMLK